MDKDDVRHHELELSNQDLKDLVVKAGLEMKTYNELIDQKKQRKTQFEENTEKLTESEIRKWMAKHGKKHLINFDDKERSKLKQYFKSLDEDGSGSIGVNELVEPLISLGLAENIDEVKKIVDSVDDDGSGQIEFKEFLKIIGSQDSSIQGNSGIIDFFKDMIKGKLAGGQISNKLPFHLIISTVRRKKMMSSLMSNDNKEKQDGEKVMNSYARYLSIKKQKDLNESNASHHSTKEKTLDKKNSTASKATTQNKLGGSATKF
jgi:Ca2+-binding EF-hand superfamily protein